MRTDHQSLTWLINIRHPEGQIARWLEELIISQYDMTIIPRTGKNHLNADALSRDVIQPCGPLGLTDLLKDHYCHYCRRAHERWQDSQDE